MLIGIAWRPELFPQVATMLCWQQDNIKHRFIATTHFLIQFPKSLAKPTACILSSESPARISESVNNYKEILRASRCFYAVASLT